MIAMAAASPTQMMAMTMTAAAPWALNCITAVPSSHIRSIGRANQKEKRMVIGAAKIISA
jgi:hypothetical protein